MTRRRLDGIEPCEPRYLMAGDIYAFDVDQNASVTPLDALLVIQQLATSAQMGDIHLDATQRQVDPIDGSLPTSAVRADVNFDGEVTPLDALLVINALNCRGDAQANNCTPLEGLSPHDARFNTALIESYVMHGLRAAIPAGTWPVRPISMNSGGSLVGMGVGVSELVLEIERPAASDRQDLIATVVQEWPGDFTTDVLVRDLTLNGNYQNIDWSDVYNDGNGFGLYLRGAQDSRFENLEIKNVWTDGIYISTVLGFSNNSRNIDFENIAIHHAGRQGVSIVGGAHLRLNNFEVSSIGRDDTLHTSPRAALDIEPEARSQRFVQHVKITNWTIERVGQGILMDGTNSERHVSDILVQNVTMSDLDGSQSLAARYVDRLTVLNVSSEGHHSANGGLGVILDETNGVLSHLSLRDMRGVNYPLQVDGSSFLEIDNLWIESVERGFMQIGAEPGHEATNTFVELSSFTFQDGESGAGKFVPVRINSNRSVAFVDGTISRIGAAPYTIQHATDIYFHDCELESGQFGIFESEEGAKILGTLREANHPT